MERPSGQSLKINVFIEGSDGMALNAARVTLLDPSGSSMLLPFSAQTASYAGSIAQSLGGTYSISARSAVSDTPKSLDIPFVSLESEPSIVELADAAGSSALSGQTLSSAAAIALSWTPVEGATAYLLRIARNGNLVYSRSIPESQAIIPAGTLLSASYSVKVEAQAIYGDPLLESAQYFSVCAIEGPSFPFQVQ